MEGKYPTLSKVVTSKGYASIDLQEKLKIQDEIGQSVLHEVAAWGRALPDEQRRLFVWAVFTCMGHEVAVEIVKQALLRPILEDGEATLLNTHREAMAKVEAREKVVKEAEFAVTVKEQRMEAENEGLRHTCQQLRNELTAERDASDRARNTIREMQAEVARLQKIEDAVKLLKSL